jgi:hypothetical protein
MPSAVPLRSTIMNIDKIVSLAQQIIDEARPTVPPPVPAVISTPEQLDAALSLAPAGSTLLLATTLVYPLPLVLKQSVSLQSEAWTTGLGVRMTADEPAPTFQAGIRVAGDHISLAGLEVRQTNPLVDIVVLSGAWPILDRCRILGDPVKGAKRGIAANGSDMTIARCYIDDCFQPYPGNDSQAICAWDMGPGLTIEDCFLRAGSETVMIGGADSSSPDRMPSNVTIRRNTITKRLEWQPLPIGVKNLIEFKAGRNILVEDNDFSNSWGKHGQVGYAVLVTVRNQDGRAPWSTVQNLVFRGNRISHVAAAINILGLDNIKETKANMPTPIGSVRPSVRASDLEFSGNAFTDIDPVIYVGSNQMILIGAGPVDVTIDQNTFDGQHIGSQVYFYGAPPSDRLVLTNNTWPKSTYGIKGDGQSSGAATWAAYVSSGVLSGNVER